MSVYSDMWVVNECTGRREMMDEVRETVVSRRERGREYVA